MANDTGFYGPGAAAAQAAVALLRAHGGGQVRLLLPIPFDVDVNQQALGLAMPEIEEVPLEPVVVRNVNEANGKGTTYELLLPAKAVRAVAEARQIASGADLLLQARGIMHGDRQLMVLAVTTDYCGAAPYMYRLRATEQSDASSEG